MHYKFALESDLAWRKNPINIQGFLLFFGDHLRFLSALQDNFTQYASVHTNYAISLNSRIDHNFVIKVANFGMSETIDISKEYFRQDQEQTIKLPI